MSAIARVFVSLGGNLGEPIRQIREAVRRLGELSGVRVLKVSSMYITEPVGPVVQPPFINAVAELSSELGPEEILEKALAIEIALGRTRIGRWGPRHIDIDLLLYADRAMNVPGLRLPHPRMHERRFVLEPLAELAPDLIHPVLGRTVSELLNTLSSEGPWVRRIDSD